MSSVRAILIGVVAFAMFAWANACSAQSVNADGTRILGVVSLRGARVQSGCEVRFYSGSDIVETTAVIAGKFSLDVSAINTPLSLVARCPGYVQEAPLVIDDQALSAGMEVRLVIVMVEAATVSGVTLWDDQAPVAGAEIRAVPHAVPTHSPLWGFSDTYSAASVSGKAGEFSLEGLHPSLEYTLTAVSIASPRYFPVVSGVMSGREQVVVFNRSLANGVALRGNVAWPGGQPVTNYSVEYGTWVNGVLNPETIVVSDAQGKFELKNLLSQAALGLQVNVPGMYPRIFGPIDVVNQSAPMQITLRDNTALRVRVESKVSGGPMSDASIFVAKRIGQSAIYSQYDTLSTDQLGEALLSAPPGSYVLLVCDGAGSSGVATTALSEEGDGVTEVQIGLSRSGAGAIAVKVTSNDGQPIPGCEVILHGVMTCSQTEGGVEIESPLVESAMLTNSQGVAEWTRVGPGIYAVGCDIPIGPEPSRHVVVFNGVSSEVLLMEDATAIRSW